MRVISGKYKGHPLKPVPTQQTRPTTDKVKEALFQMIGPFFNGGICLDLFAGSGALGIEALSRGMNKAIFVDKNPKSIQTIYTNLNKLQLENETEVYRTDAFMAIKAASKRNLSFNLIFLDPPYKKVSYEKLLKEIEKHGLLEQNGIIICEHDAGHELPSLQGQFIKTKTELYGNTTALSFYQLEEVK